MKKLLALVLVLVLFALGSYLWLGTALAKALEVAGQHALQVPTRVESASLAPWSGRASLAGLEVANPPGFEGPAFLELRAVRTQVALGTLTSDLVEIDEISLDGLRISLEVNPNGTNFGKLLDNIRRSRERTEPQPEQREPAPGNAPDASSERHLRIAKLVINDVQVASRVASQFTATLGGELAIPRIELENLGGEQGVTLEQLVGLTIEAVLNASAKVQGGLSEALAQQLEASLGQLRGGLSDELQRKLAPELDALERQLGPGAKDAVERLGGALQGLVK